MALFTHIWFGISFTFFASSVNISAWKLLKPDFCFTDLCRAGIIKTKRFLGSLLVSVIVTIPLVNQSTTSCPQRRSQHPQTCSSTRFQMRRSPSPGLVHPARWPVTGWPSPLLVLTALRRGPCRCPSHPTHMLISPTCSQAHCTASTSTPSMVEWRASRLWEKRLPVSITMDKRSPN